MVARSCCRSAHPVSRATARARPVTDCSSPERPVASARARLRRGVASALALRASRSLLPLLTFSTGRTVVGSSRLQAALASNPLNQRCRARKCLIAFKIENPGQLRSLRCEGVCGRTSEVADRKRALTGACNHQPSEPVSFAAVQRARTARPAVVPLLRPPPTTKQGLRRWPANTWSRAAKPANAAPRLTQQGSGSACDPCRVASPLAGPIQDLCGVESAESVARQRPCRPTPHNSALNITPVMLSYT